MENTVNILLKHPHQHMAVKIRKCCLKFLKNTILGKKAFCFKQRIDPLNQTHKYSKGNLHLLSLSFALTSCWDPRWSDFTYRNASGETIKIRVFIWALCQIRVLSKTLNCGNAVFRLLAIDWSTRQSWPAARGFLAQGVTLHAQGLALWGWKI